MHCTEHAIKRIGKKKEGESMQLCLVRNYQAINLFANLMEDHRKQQVLYPAPYNKDKLPTVVSAIQIVSR